MGVALVQVGIASNILSGLPTGLDHETLRWDPVSSSWVKTSNLLNTSSSSSGGSILIGYNSFSHFNTSYVGTYGGYTNTRMVLRGTTNTNLSQSLHIISSLNNDILRVRDDGFIGVGIDILGSIGAKYHQLNGAFLLEGGETSDYPTLYGSSEGVRLLLSPKLKSFRAGELTLSYSTYLDESNVGELSYAFGYNHLVQAEHSAILSGYQNQIYTDSSSSSISGGATNNILIDSALSFIGGGSTNTIENSRLSFIGAGSDNNILNQSGYSVISGGQNNLIDGLYTLFPITGSLPLCESSVIVGGDNNKILKLSGNSSIIGGVFNTIQEMSSESVITGGELNSIRLLSEGSVIIGGSSNEISFKSGNSVIFSGALNVINFDELYVPTYPLNSTAPINNIVNINSTSAPTTIAQVEVTDIGVLGEILSLNIINGGSGYPLGIGDVTGTITGLGSGCTIEFSVNGAGVIISYTILTAGSGYINNHPHESLGVYYENKSYDFILGGVNNKITGSVFSFIGVGYDNLINDSNRSFILSGYDNSIDMSIDNILLFGNNNILSNNTYSLFGGYNNNVSGLQQGFVYGNNNVVNENISSNINYIFGNNNIIDGGIHYIFGDANQNLTPTTYSFIYGTGNSFEGNIVIHGTGNTNIGSSGLGGELLIGYVNDNIGLINSLFIGQNNSNIGLTYSLMIGQNNTTISNYNYSFINGINIVGTDVSYSLIDGFSLNNNLITHSIIMGHSCLIDNLLYSMSIGNAYDLTNTMYSLNIGLGTYLTNTMYSLNIGLSTYLTNTMYSLNIGTINYLTNVNFSLISSYLSTVNDSDNITILSSINNIINNCDNCAIIGGGLVNVSNVSNVIFLNSGGDAIGDGYIKYGGGESKNYTSTSSTTYNIGLDEFYIIFENVGNITATLPDVTGDIARHYVITKNEFSAQITITPTTGTINGNPSYTMSDINRSIELYLNNNNSYWVVMSMPNKDIVLDINSDQNIELYNDKVLVDSSLGVVNLTLVPTYTGHSIIFVDKGGNASINNININATTYNIEPGALTSYTLTSNYETFKLMFVGDKLIII